MPVSVPKETPLNQWTSSPLSAILRLYGASVLSLSQNRQELSREDLIQNVPRVKGCN